MLKKLLAGLVLVLLVVVPAYANTANDIIRETNEGNDLANNEVRANLAHTGSYLLETSFLGTTVCLLGGTMASPECKSNSIGVAYGGGAIGGINRAVVAMYENPPADTATYVADVLNSAHIVPQAYAQGLGFASLSPVLQAWKLFRNLAYLFLILVMLAIGFLIMFRQKMGSSAVTAQQAIPNVILALFAVTFSYAIAGLLIDLMYVVMFLLVGVFGQETNLIDKNIVQLTIYILTHGTLSSVDAIGDFIDGSLNGFGGVVSNAVSWLSEITLLIIILVVIIFSMMKLFFSLLKTYITIIMTITLSPLLLMTTAIPGRGSTFTGWIKSLVGNLAVFPAVLMVLIVYSHLIDARTGDSIGAEGTGFLPPYLFGSGTGDALTVLIGLGLVLALPEVVDKVKKALGAGDGGVFGELMGAAYKKVADRRGIATAMVGGAALGVGGAALGAGAGYLLAQRRRRAQGEDAVPRSSNFSYAGTGAAVGAALPLAIPIVRRGARVVNNTGNFVRNWAAFADAFGKDTGDIGATASQTLNNIRNWGNGARRRPGTTAVGTEPGDSTGPTTPGQETVGDTPDNHGHVPRSDESTPKNFPDA
ncbi:MAG TPA: hypothetical protein VD999_02355 [Vitreimonas sp.]|nr:hypothetical protein [Vitreimonas sp.]